MGGGDVDSLPSWERAGVMESVGGGWLSLAGLWGRGTDQVELGGSFDLQKLSWGTALWSKLKLRELHASLEQFWFLAVQT